MPFNLTQAASTDAIGEDQYGVAAGEIAFTPITSCMVLAAFTGGGEICGIHLALFDAGGDPFVLADVATVDAQLTALGAVRGTMILFGEESFWPEDVLAALAALGAPSQAADVGSGTYGVRSENPGELTWFRREASVDADEGDATDFEE